MNIRIKDQEDKRARGDNDLQDTPCLGVDKYICPEWLHLRE